MASKWKRRSLAAATPIQSPGVETDRETPIEIIPSGEVSIKIQQFWTDFPDEFNHFRGGFWKFSYHVHPHGHFRSMRMLKDVVVYEKGKVLEDLDPLQKLQAMRLRQDKQTLFEHHSLTVLLQQVWVVIVLHNWLNIMLIA